MSAQEEKKGGKRTPVKVVADAKPSIDKKTPGTDPSGPKPRDKRSLEDRVDALQTQVDDLVKVVNQHADATTQMKELLTKTSDYAIEKSGVHDKCILDWARVGKRQQKEINDQRTTINEIAATVKSIKERLDADAHKKKMEERWKRASNEQAPSDRARILNGEDSD